MFERFSADAKQAIISAHREAHADGAPTISTGHLLVGMATDSASPGGAVLADLGVRAADLRAQLGEPSRDMDTFDDDDRNALAAIGIDLAEVQRRLGDQLDRGPRAPLPEPRTRHRRHRGGLRMSSDCRTAVSAAISRAMAEGTRKVRSDHLLLGVVDDLESVGAELLAQRGVRADHIHRAVQDRRNAA